MVLVLQEADEWSSPGVFIAPPAGAWPAPGRARHAGLPFQEGYRDRRPRA